MPLYICEPPPHLPSDSDHAQPKKSHVSKFLISCGCLSLLFTSFFIVVTPLLRVAYISPEVPYVSIVNPVSVTSVNISSDEFVTATWEFTVSVKNPNQKSISYDDIAIWIGQNCQVAKVTFPPFVQGGNNVTTLVGSFKFKSWLGGGFALSSTDDSVNGTVVTSGVARLEMTMVARVKYDAWVWSSRPGSLYAKSDHELLVLFSSYRTSATVLTSSECDVFVLEWFILKAAPIFICALFGILLFSAFILDRIVDEKRRTVSQTPQRDPNV